MSPQGYRILEHTADTGFEVIGSSIEELFESSAKAFFHMLWHIDTDMQSRPETIEFAGGDVEELMVNFLEEFLYRYDAKGLVCSKIKVLSVDDTMLCARAWMQPFDRDHDKELLGVKAVTYHQLYIARKNNTWVAQIFLDI
jgi:SHS2 domain-containing protein